MKVKKNLIKYKDPNTGKYVSIPVIVGEGTEEKFELIESFEVTEELASFIRTAEPDGTPYDFQKIKVVVVQPISINNGLGGINCSYNISPYKNAFITSSDKAFNKTYTTFSKYNAYIENGILKGDAITIASMREVADYEQHVFENVYNTAIVYRPLFDVVEAVKLDKIDRLTYCSLNGYPIPVGTKIDIYAVRS
jgi:hypothetical protein